MTKKKYKKQEIPPIILERIDFLGALLREYRWEQDYTLSEVQEHSRIHHRTISRIENGENVSLVTLFRYMNFLEVDLPEIAFHDDEI
jgi:transcriptional regulator with XRE-family HTH domain